MVEDQLATVREMANSITTTNCQVITFASGKGGVGKTNMALNTAIALVEGEKNVLIIDADSHLANVDLLLGITPTYTLQDVLLGDRAIRDVILKHECGLDVLPNSSNVSDVSLKGGQLAHLLVHHLWSLRQRYEYIIIDTGASLSEEIVDFMVCADRVLVFATPEPTAIADAYALIKVLHRKKPAAQIQIAINLVESEHEAVDVVERFSLVVGHFLDRTIGYAGYIVADWKVVQAVKKGRPFILEFPEAAASACIRTIAHNLMAADESR